jgi:tagatose 6-phosphate kinase
VSPVGAGDALLAGLLAARRAERSFADSLRHAVACGAASTQHEQPGMLDPREVQRLSALVEVAELAPAQA